MEILHLIAKQMNKWRTTMLTGAVLLIMICQNAFVSILSALQYQHLNQTKKDIIDVLELYRGLTFKLENFGMYLSQFGNKSYHKKLHNVNWNCFLPKILPVFNDGTNKELLNINGTIPVVYKSK